MHKHAEKAIRTQGRPAGDRLEIGNRAGAAAVIRFCRPAAEVPA
jgi:hypothetical protein